MESWVSLGKQLVKLIPELDQTGSDGWLMVGGWDVVPSLANRRVFSKIQPLDNYVHVWDKRVYGSDMGDVDDTVK